VLPAYNQGNTLGRVSIYPDGRVRLGGTKSFAYISLDGISSAAGE
jgi:hypothetical protein